MATVASIIADIASLSYEDRISLKDRLIRAFCSHPSSMEVFVKEERFSGGLVCPVCGCVHVIRNGHRNDGTQRYICRDCGKTFVAASNSIVSYTKKELYVWEKYIDCLINGFSIRKSADICP